LKVFLNELDEQETKEKVFIDFVADLAIKLFLFVF
jgi:hypothetical protein